MKKLNMLPTSASFLVTEDCNLRCTYCFENHMPNHMTEEVAKAGLEYLCKNAIKEKLSSFGVTIFGGEPMTKPDLVEYILDYGSGLAEEYNMKFDVMIVTNATILNKELANMIRAYVDKTDLMVQLSVDGIKEIQDAYRVTRNGGPSFHIVEKNIPMWKEIFKDKPHLLNIHGCSNKETLPYLYENFLFFREVWGLENTWFMPIHSEDWSFEDVAIYEEQLGKIADHILYKTREKKDLSEIYGMAPLDRCLGNGTFAASPCGAGKNYVTITASGEIFPCHQIYFNDPDHITKIGTVMDGGYLDDDRRRLFLEYENSDMSCSKLNPSCNAVGCYRCIAENWQQNGSILSTVDLNGARCLMSHVEKRLQDRVKIELEKLGLLNNMHYDSGRDCMCNIQMSNGEEVLEEHKCNCGDSKEHSCSCEDKSEFEELMAASQIEILKELSALKELVNTKEAK